MERYSHNQPQPENGSMYDYMQIGRFAAENKLTDDYLYSLRFDGQPVNDQIHAHTTSYWELAILYRQAASVTANEDDRQQLTRIAEDIAVCAINLGRGTEAIVDEVTGETVLEAGQDHLFRVVRESYDKDPDETANLWGSIFNTDLHRIVKEADRSEKTAPQSDAQRAARRFLPSLTAAAGIAAAAGLLAAQPAAAATNNADEPKNTLVLKDAPRHDIELSKLTAKVVPQSTSTSDQQISSVSATTPGKTAAAAQPDATTSQERTASVVPSPLIPAAAVAPVAIPAMPDRPPVTALSISANQAEYAAQQVTAVTPPVAVRTVNLDTMTTPTPDTHKAATVGSVTISEFVPTVSQHAPSLDTLPGQSAMATAEPVVLPTAPTHTADLDSMNTNQPAPQQTYTPPSQAPLPAPEAPQQPVAPAPPASTPTAPETVVPTNEQQDFTNAAQKLIDHGGEWARRGQAMKFFINDPDLHMTPSQAAGFVGNLLGENDTMDPACHQAGGPAFGIAQWEGGRLEALKTFGGDTYDQLDTQLQFIKHELLNGERNSLNKLRQVANDRKQAASIVMTYYERPGDPREAERRAYADIVGDAFNTEYQKITADRAAAQAARMVIGTEVKTLFNQCDPAWGETRVDGVRTCDMGCGPTDVAMVVNALTGRNITPRDVYDFMTANNLWLPNGQGTSYDAILAAAKHWGVKGYQLGADKMKNADTYRAVLSNGGLIVAAGNGPAGNKAASLPFVPIDIGAHYVIVRGVDQNGNLLIADSYPKTADTNTKAWGISDFLGKVFGAVVFTKS